MEASSLRRQPRAATSRRPVSLKKEKAVKANWRRPSSRWLAGWGSLVRDLDTSPKTGYWSGFYCFCYGFGAGDCQRLCCQHSEESVVGYSLDEEWWADAGIVLRTMEVIDHGRPPEGRGHDQEGLALVRRSELIRTGEVTRRGPTWLQWPSRYVW